MSNRFIVATEYSGPTNTRGGRILLTYEDAAGIKRRKVIAIDYGWRTDNAHREAAAEHFGVKLDHVTYSLTLGAKKFYIVESRNR